MKKKIRVLQFPIANARGGITQYVLNNWHFIDRKRFHFDFVTLNKRIDFENELLADGCKIHCLSCYAEENEKKFIDEMSNILSIGYDIVHLHTGYWKGFLVEELARKYGASKIIVHAHTTMIDILDDRIRQEALKKHERLKALFNVEMATHYCACSKEAADWLFGEQIPRNKIRIFKNAIDVNKFFYKPNIRKSYRKKIGVEDCFVIGNVGRFVYQKNHEFLLDVFQAINKEMKDTRLLLIGDGELLESMKEKAKIDGIENKVLFMGKRKDVAELMQAMDIFCLPSRFEGLGMVLIEAQCNGLNCIASENVPKEAKITKHLVFLPLDIQVWKENIVRRYNNFHREKSDMRQIIKMGFSMTTQIKEVEELYNLY